MRYRKLGSTGLEVSEIGFGGEWMDGTLEETVEVVRRCAEAGVNLLDCWMPDPTRRSNLGDALAELGQRDRWVIQGHLGSTWQGEQYVRSRDMDVVRPAFEDLLARFHTDHVELGMIHYVDKLSEFDQIMSGPFMGYVRELVADGTIQHVGLSTHNQAVARRALEADEIEMILFSVNPAYELLPACENMEERMFGSFDDVLERMDPERAEVYATAERLGKGITVMKAYAGGRLLDAARSPFGVALTPVQCLHYALTRPAVASVLVGYGCAAHVDEALAYETAAPGELDYASVLAAAPHHALSGQCTYCGHCAPCPVGIDVAAVNKYLDLATARDEVPDSVRGHYLALGATASACVGCGGCEERCPFGVPVREHMARAAALFGA